MEFVVGDCRRHVRSEMRDTSLAQMASGTDRNGPASTLNALDRPSGMIMQSEPYRSVAVTKISG